MVKIDSRPLREILEDYCKRGWYLFPIKRETKLPAIKDNLKLASNDIEQLMKWADKFPLCNWGLSLAKSGLVAVDVDATGVNPWEALCFNHGEPETLKAASGSGVGSHYVFKVVAGKRYRGKIVKGIDVKHNGFIAIFPSIHPVTKNQYRFENESVPKEYQEWLGKLIEKDEAQPGKSSPVYKFAGADWYKKIIEQIKEKDLGYDQWLRLGMALHSAFDGSDEGLQMYLDLSSGTSFKEGDLEKARSKWESFRKSESGVGIGTFIFHARALGCAIPSPSFEEDKEAFGVADGDDASAGNEEKDEVWLTNYYGHKFTENAEFVVKEINRRGYAMLGESQEGVIIKHWTDGNGVEQFRTMNVENFKNSIKDHSLKTMSANGKPKMVPTADIWLRSTKKSRYRNVVFKPDADFEDLNLWSGIPCSPMEGDASLCLELIEVLCGGNRRKARYLTQWLAHMVQKPAEKCVTVPVIISEEQGAGKGLFTDGLLQAMLSRSFYIRIDKSGTIKERFNSEQSRKFLTVLDEASWRGDHELVNVLKSLTGSNTMTVEEKFGGRYTIENYSRYMVTSNSVDAIKLELSNRRYLVLEALISWKGTDKFKKLADGLRYGDLHKIFYGHLMKVDISDFDPFKFPESLDTGGEDTKVESMGPVGQFWFDKLFETDEDEQLVFLSKPPYVVVPKNGAYMAFQEFCKNNKTYGKTFSNRAFLRETEKLVPELMGLEMICKMGGKAVRTWAISPQSFAEAYCKRSRLAMPDDFEELGLIHFGDFEEAS